MILTCPVSSRQIVCQQKKNICSKTKREADFSHEASLRNATQTNSVVTPRLKRNFKTVVKPLSCPKMTDEICTVAMHTDSKSSSVDTSSSDASNGGFQMASVNAPKGDSHMPGVIATNSLPTKRKNMRSKTGYRSRCKSVELLITIRPKPTSWLLLG